MMFKKGETGRNGVDCQCAGLGTAAPAVRPRAAVASCLFPFLETTVPHLRFRELYSDVGCRSSALSGGANQRPARASYWIRAFRIIQYHNRLCQANGQAGQGTEF